MSSPSGAWRGTTEERVHGAGSFPSPVFVLPTLFVVLYVTSTIISAFADDVAREQCTERRKWLGKLTRVAATTRSSVYMYSST